MALDIDGFAVLKVIAAHPSAFPDIAAEVGKTARALVIKQVKSKTSDLKKIRDVLGAIGASNFKLIIDGLPDAQIKTLVAKLDKNHPEIRTETALWRRQHLIALVDGSKEPAPKAKVEKPAARRSAPKKPSAKTPSAKKPEPQAPVEPETLAYRSAGARRKR